MNLAKEIPLPKVSFCEGRSPTTDTTISTRRQKVCAFLIFCSLCHSFVLYTSLLLSSSCESNQRMQDRSQKAVSSSHPTLASISVPTEHPLLLIQCNSLFSHLGLFPFSLTRRNSCRKSKIPVTQAD